MTWDLARIKGLVNSGIEESDQLDFKRCAAISRPLGERQRKEMSKDVSAFANYPGGAIIVGVIEETIDAGGRKVKRVTGMDTGFDEGEIDKAWLEDVLPNLVSHPLMHFNVVPVPLGAGKSIYVLEIPRSPTAPHQAIDRLYYGRKGARSVPLSHLEIEALRLLGTPSGLELHFKLGSTTGNVRPDGFGLTSCNFDGSVRNTGVSIVRGVFVEVFLPDSRSIQYRCGWQLDPERHEFDGHTYWRYFGEVKDLGNEYTLYPSQESPPCFAITVAPMPSDRGMVRGDFGVPDVVWRIHTGSGYRQEGRFRLIDLYDHLVVLQHDRY